MNFGAPKPAKELSEFRNPKTSQRSFRISEPQNQPKKFPNFGTPKPAKEVSEFRNPKTSQGRSQISEPQNHSKTFWNVIYLQISLLKDRLQRLRLKSRQFPKIQENIFFYLRYDRQKTAVSRSMQTEEQKFKFKK